MHPSARADLPALTGLRFFAAAAVVFFHFVRWRFADGGFFRRFISCGFLAVGLFFVLSGFILSHAHATESFASPVSRRKFWRHRFARIYPVYVLGMVAGALVTARLHWVSARELASVEGALRLLAVVFVMPGLSHRTMFLFDWAAWSLTSETLFYALFPWIAPRLRAMSTRCLLLLASVLSIVTWMAPQFYLAIDPDHLGRALRLGDELVVWGHYMKFFPIFHAHEFVWGMTVFEIRTRNRAVFSKISSRMLALVVLGCVSVSWTIAYALVQRGYLTLHSGLLAPMFAVLVAALAERPVVGIARVCAWRPSVILGRASYATYMLHVPLYLWMDHELGTRLGKMETCLLYLLVLPALSIAVFYGWERPWQRRLTSAPRFETRRAFAT